MSLLCDDESNGQVVLEDLPRTAISSWTSPVWTPELFREICITVEGVQSAFSYLRFQANADSGNNYEDFGVNGTVGGGVALDGAAFGSNGFARLGVITPASVNATIQHKIWFSPRVTGTMRLGKCDACAFLLGGNTSDVFKRDVPFAWNDVVTPVTFVTLSWNAVTFTGRIRIVGYP